MNNTHINYHTTFTPLVQVPPNAKHNQPDVRKQSLLPNTPIHASKRSNTSAVRMQKHKAHATSRNFPGSFSLSKSTQTHTQHKHLDKTNNFHYPLRMPPLNLHPPLLSTQVPRMTTPPTRTTRPHGRAAPLPPPIPRLLLAQIPPPCIPAPRLPGRAY